MHEKQCLIPIVIWIQERHFNTAFCIRWPENMQFNIGTRRKICIFIHIIKCQPINYNSVKFQVNQLRNKKVTIYRFALSYEQEGSSLRHFDFMLVDGSDEIGYFPWKFQSRALLT